MEHEPLIAVLVNRLIQWLTGLFGWHTAPIAPHVIMAFLVTLILVLFFGLASRRVRLFPTPLQSFLESVYNFFAHLVDDMIGHEGRRFLPMVGTLGLFILLSNLLGLLPEMGSPTSNINVTAACALTIFIYYNYHGIRHHGILGYLKTFAGPAWWLAWLFFPVEIISHFARPLSLTVRLFANIFGEDLVILIIASLVPFVAPLPVMALAVFTSLVQAYIFILLSSVYLAGAVAEEH